jgi:DNA-binding CsgD family transcriptional regulator/PAS domain-containing protein
MTRQDKALFELIDTIYLCGSGNEGWQAFLDHYGRLFPSLKSALSAYDRRFQRTTIFCSSNYDPAFMRAYEAHFFRINPWRDVLLRSPLVPQVSWGSEVSLEDLARTEFYADWVRPQENIVRGFTTMLVDDHDRFVNMTSNVNPKYIDEARRAARSFAIIGPHLQRAFALSRQLADQRAEAESLQSILNTIAAAIFVVDASGRIKTANARAEHLLTEGRLVHGSPAGRLCFRNSADHRAVMGCLHSAAGDTAAAPGAIGLKGCGDKRHVAFVSPLVTQRRDPAARRMPLWDPSNAFAVFVIDAAESPQPPMQRIADVLGVTGAEARLAAAVLQDKSLNEYADEQHISIHTARIQMRSLLAKTNTHRQAQLVGLLARLFATTKVA